MTVGNIGCNGDCLSSYNLDFLRQVQDSLDKKIAKLSKNEYYSSINDLGCQINEEGFEDLVDWKNILIEISNCNPCFKDYCAEEIFGLVKQDINNV